MQKPCEKCKSNERGGCICDRYKEYFKFKWNETVKPFRKNLERWQKANGK